MAGNWELEGQFAALQDFGLVQNVTVPQCVGEGEGTASPHCSAEAQTWTAVTTLIRSTIYYFMELWELFRTIKYLFLW